MKLLDKFRAWNWRRKLAPVYAHFLKTELGNLALQAAIEVHDHAQLQTVAEGEPLTSFCPRCGQLPTGDRRMEEAREEVITRLGYIPKMSELNFALEFFSYYTKLTDKK